MMNQERFIIQHSSLIIAWALSIIKGDGSRRELPDGRPGPETTPRQPDNQTVRRAEPRARRAPSDWLIVWPADGLDSVGPDLA